MKQCTVLIPALNEADNIGDVLDGFANWPRDKIVVVDNGSRDRTVEVAQGLGATVLHEPRRGKGFAVVRGAAWAQTDFLFLCDADIKGITESSVYHLMAAAGDSDVVARLSINRRSARVTTFTAKPLLEALGMSSVAEPIGGLALVSRRFLLEQHLHGGWGFDIGVTISALGESGKIPEVEISGVSHRNKATSALTGMANQVLQAGLQSAGVVPWSHEDCTKCEREQSYDSVRAYPDDSHYGIGPYAHSLTLPHQARRTRCNTAASVGMQEDQS